MAQDAQSLLTAGACFSCLTKKELQIVIAQLLCQINAGTSAAYNFFRAGNYGGNQPNWTPTGDVGIGIDTSTTPATQWLYYQGQWH